MAGKINDGRVHGRNCRATGCDCPERKAAHAAYMRERRAKAKAAKAQMGRLRAVPSTADRVPSAQPVSVDGGGPLRVAALSEIASIPDVEAAHPLLIASILALADQVDSGQHPQTAVAAIKLLAGLTADLRTTPEAVRLVAVPEPTQVEQLMAMLGSSL